MKRALTQNRGGCLRPGRSGARASAFSLAELIVVMGLIVLLLGLLMPAVSRMWRQSESVKCQSQLRQLGFAISVYANENRGAAYPYRGEPPDAPTWAEILFEEERPAVLVWPSGADTDIRSYQLNTLMLHGIMRMSGANARGVPASRIVLAGESRPGELRDYSWADPVTGEVSWDLARHGPGLMSNYLWLDLHVDNVAPPPPVPPEHDPWFVAIR
jgi:prepilin-type processing-associated H-X9-DG protein